MPQAVEPEEAPTVFDRHPKTTLFVVLLTLFLIVCAIAEVVLRTMGSLNVSYYTGHSDPGVHRYPYGEIPVNRSGYPDNEEFVANDDLPRIAYVGDSVTYGVGAGYPYRIPDLIEAQHPAMHHWVMAGLGEHLEAAELLKDVRHFGLNRVIYLMNLNDILPMPIPGSDGTGSDRRPSWIVSLRESFVGSMDGFMRGRSYLYTYLRVAVKNWLQKKGFETSGYEAFELNPGRNADLVRYAARTVADAFDVIRDEAGTTACVVILPYEMQISRRAAARYQEMGFSWEAGFEVGSTQKMLLQEFNTRGVRAFDARDAFQDLDPDVGETFVFDRGDKTDWNHPTRDGHKLIAQWLLERPEFRSECLGIAD